MSKGFQSESSETGAWSPLTGEAPEQPAEECYILLQQALHDLQQTQKRLGETQHREQLKRQITSQIRTSLNLSTILQEVVSATRELLQVESCHFTWYRPHADPPGWETITEARLPHIPSRLGWYAEENVELLTAAILNQERLQVNDLETLEQPGLQRVFRNLSIKSHLALPIRTQSGAVGTLNCTSFSELRLWSEEDVEWLQDILDQLAIAIHQAELDAELRTSKTRFDAFFAAANAGLVIFDRQLCYININEALAEINGIPAADHIGKSIQEVLPQLAPTLEPLFQGILDTGKPILDYELIGETPKQPGVTRHWLASYYPLFDEDGDTFGVGGVVIEITDRVRAEDKRKQTDVALQEQTNLLQLILNSMSDGVVVTDEQGKFLVFNPAAEHLFGDGATDTQANEWSQQYGLFLPDRVTPFPPDELPLVQAIRGEEVKDVELFVRHAQAPDGYWMLTSASPLRDESGQLKGGIAVCRNVTDRKQAENALKQSEERYRSLASATSQIVWMADVEGRIAPNPAWRDFTGQTEAEFGDFGWLDAIHPNDREHTTQVWMRAVQTKSLYETEYRIRAADGDYRYFVVRGVPVLNPDGSIREWVGTCTDIHDRKRAEQRLLQNMEMLDLASDSIIIRDMNDRIVYWNQGAEKLYGWTKAEVSGEYIHTFLKTTFPQPLEEVLADFLERGNWDGELHHVTRDGQPILVASRWTLQRDASGQPFAQLEINSDITQRKQVEISLQQSEERLQAILDNSPAVFYMKDPQGQFLTVNRQFESLFHRSKAEIVGKRNHELFDQDLAEIFDANDRAVLEAGSAMQWEEVAPHDDGLHTYLSLKFPLLAPDGSAYALCGMSTDITDRKQAEIALEQAKEAAEAANRAKSEFLANMSHELRTPLNGVIGYAQILQRAKTLSEEDRARIEVIHQCGSHLLTLINDILDLSKIEARKTELLPTDFHLPAFLQGVAEMCRIRAELKGIQFRYESASELPVGIHADEKRLRQVLINLLSNAIKFTDAGSVTFTISFASEGKIRFEVRDTGIGVPQDKLQAIFQPFEQVSDAKRQSEGTGLGLAISQEIVQLMGSTIQVQSEVSVGSIFWFDVNLPEAAEWVKTAQADRHGQIIGIKNRQPKILVVDDKWENRSVVSKLLNPIGFDVVEAASGQEGWQRVVEFQPDLIITDLMMPHMDGFKLIKQIRESETLKDLIIIVSSASVFEADQYRSIEAGGNDFLPKPVLASELLQKLQKHLKLEWIYEQQQLSIKTDMDNAELIAPPAAELEMLYELTMKGSFKGILKQAALIEQMDQRYCPFVKKLHQLAKGFQDKEILTLIQSYR